MFDKPWKEIGGPDPSLPPLSRRTNVIIIAVLVTVYLFGFIGWAFIASGRILRIERNPLRIIIMTDPRNA